MTHTEKLVQIFAAKCPPTENLTVPQRRKLSNTLGLPVPLIMIANPAKAEEQAAAVLAALPSVSDANKQEIITHVPQLAFVFEAAAAAAPAPTASPRGRGAAKKTDDAAPATTAAAVPQAPSGTVSEGVDLRIQQIELRLQRLEEAMGATHERLVDVLQNTTAILSMLHYAAQMSGHTEQTTIAGYAAEAGASLAGAPGGR